MAQAAAAATGLRPQDFAVCSTGIIGVELNIQAIEKGFPPWSPPGGHPPRGLPGRRPRHPHHRPEGEGDRRPPWSIGGKTVTIGAIAKGSGMIHPNMGTMLCGITTDCAIDGALLQDMLRPGGHQDL